MQGMNIRMNMVQRSIATFMLMWVFNAVAADVSINDDVVPRGWARDVSSQIPIQFDFRDPVGYNGYVDAVVTSTGSQWGVSSSDFRGMPIELLDKTNGHTGFYLTVKGSLGLTVWGKGVSSDNPRPEPGRWEVADHKTPATTKDGHDYLYRWRPTIKRDPLRGWGGTLSGWLQAILYCEPYVGDVCVIPADALDIPSLYVRLYTTTISLREPQMISQAGGLLGVISFSRPCMFNVVNNRITDIELPRLTEKALHSRIDTTNVSIHCPQGPGKGADSDKAGKVNIKLTPFHGEVAPDMARTSKDGLGIVFKLGNNKPKSCNGNHTFGTFELKPLSVEGIPKNNNDPIHKETQINWGYCQYDPDARPGKFDTTINYEIWLQ